MMHVWTQSLQLTEIDYCLKDWVDTQKEKQLQVGIYCVHGPCAAVRVMFPTARIPGAQLC
jgi:hypothetical protein